MLQDSHEHKYWLQSEVVCKIMRIQGRIENAKARGSHDPKDDKILANYIEQFEAFEEELENLMACIRQEEGTTDLVVHGSDI